MSAHDWTLVEDGIFHDFHQEWIREIKRSLNNGLLPEGYYALAEQIAGNAIPDVLTLQVSDPDFESSQPSSDTSAETGGTAVSIEPPKVALWGESDRDFYVQKQNAVVVRHSSDDEVVATVKVVSRGNKSSRKRLRSIVEKIASLLHEGIHQLVLDLYPPGLLDPHGLHAEIWQEIDGELNLKSLPTKPLLLASYEADVSTRAYVEGLAVGELLTSMPLFLRPGAHVEVPLEETYQRAFSAVPQRWRRVQEKVE